MKKFFAPLPLVLGFVGVMLAGFIVSAHAAQAAAPDNGTILDLLKPVFDQVMAGHYVAAAAFALVLSVGLLRRYAPGRAGAFMHTDLGGAFTTLVMSVGGALATATVAGAVWHWGMLWAAFMVGLTAMGGYTAIKKLVLPLLAKAPAWMQPIFQVLTWIFDKRFQDPVKEAEKAGDAAVAANPSGGADDVVGKPTEL